MHQALYHWNIFIDSSGVRLGPPRYVLEKLLATNLDPVDDSEALNEILEALRVKKKSEMTAKKLMPKKTASLLPPQLSWQNTIPIPWRFSS